MEHTIGKDPEFIKLHQFFKKMEKIAETMEIDDTDLEEYEYNKALPEYSFLIKNILSIAHKRNETFVNSHQSEDKEDAKMELTVNNNKK